MIRFLFVHLLCLSFFSLSLRAAAEDPPADLLQNNLQPTTPGKKQDASEFVFQPYPGAVLIPIYVWGAVGRAGIYRVPIHTNVVTLLSLAGGPIDGAKLDELTIRRFGPGNQHKVMLIDASELVTADKTQAIPSLEANDVVYLPKTQPWISNNAMQVITVAGAILSIVVSFLIIKQLNK